MIEAGQASAGVDEAGRGSWAGPLVVAACYIPEGTIIPRGLTITDSKMCSEAQRNTAYAYLKKTSVFTVAIVSAEYMSTKCVQEATRVGMQRCMKNIAKKVDKKNLFFLVDGNFNFPLPFQHRFFVRGDSTYRVIAAASIIAKVTRDRLMKRLDKKYPQYGFERHKGYGTTLHRERLEKYGISPIHRTGFRPMKDMIHVLY